MGIRTSKAVALVCGGALFVAVSAANAIGQTRTYDQLSPSEKAEFNRRMNDPKWLQEQGNKAIAEKNARDAAALAEIQRLRAGRLSYSADFGMWGCRSVVFPDGSMAHYTQKNRKFDPAEEPLQDRDCRGESVSSAEVDRFYANFTPKALNTPPPAKAAAAPVSKPVVSAISPSPSAAVRPSFDCAKASTNVEKLICADATLAAKDRDVSARYRGWLAAIKAGRLVDDADEVTADQRTWVAQRNACRDAACVASAYDARLEDLPEAP